MEPFIHFSTLFTLLVAACFLCLEAVTLWHQGRLREALAVMCIVLGFTGILLRLGQLALRQDFTRVLWPFLLSLGLIAIGSTTLAWFTTFRRKSARYRAE